MRQNTVFGWQSFVRRKMAWKQKGRSKESVVNERRRWRRTCGDS